MDICVLQDTTKQQHSLYCPFNKQQLTEMHNHSLNFFPTKTQHQGTKSIFTNIGFKAGLSDWFKFDAPLIT